MMMIKTKKNSLMIKYNLINLINYNNKKNKKNKKNYKNHNKNIKININNKKYKKVIGGIQYNKNGIKQIDKKMIK